MKKKSGNIDLYPKLSGNFGLLVIFYFQDFCPKTSKLKMSDTLVPPEGQTSFSGIPAAQFIGKKLTIGLGFCETSVQNCPNS